METNFETNIPQPPKKGNRTLAYTLGFLLLFSIGTYAFGAATYHPGDTNDPSCAPGGPGCYVSVFPDDTGHSHDFLQTDGAGNVSWATPSGTTPTLQDVLNTGATTDGVHPILGGNFLRFDVAHEIGISNSNGNGIFNTDAYDNGFLQGYDSGHAGSGTIGFDSSGTVFINSSTITEQAALASSINAYSKIGTIGMTDLGAVMSGSFSYLDNMTASRQDIVGVTTGGFGSYGDSALLAHADSSQNYAANIAFDAAGVPTLTAVTHQNASTLTAQMTPTQYQVTGVGKVFDINVGTNSYGLGDLANKNNSTYLSINDGTSVAAVNGYINTTIPPPVSIVTFNGSGTNNLTPSGTFSGSSSATFVVRIAQFNKGNPSYSSRTGSFTANEALTVTGTGAGSTATYLSDTGGPTGNILFTDETIAGAGIGVGSVLHGVTSGATATISAFGGGLADYFMWTSSDGGSSGSPLIAGSNLLGDGITVTFGGTTGHHLNDSWTFSYIYPTGKMLSLNGQAGTFTIGDVDAIKNGTKFKVDDAARTVSITGSGGTCTFDGTAGATCLSDERLKTNVADLPDDLAQINQLRPVTYTWIDPTMSQAQNVGLIAQEVQQVFPNIVSQVGDTGYLGVKYEGLIVPAIKAIQELDMKIEPLTSIDPAMNGSLASLIVQFLQNAVVTIKEATIGTLRVSDQVCADDVCVTKDQFKNLLLQAGGTSSTPPASPVVLPADPVTPPADPVTPPSDSGASADSTPPATDPVVTPPADSGSADSGTTPPATDPGTPADPVPTP